MSQCLIYAEANQAQLKKSSAELISWASENNLEPVVALFGDATTETANQCAAYGASKVKLASDEAFKDYNPEMYAATLQSIVDTESPTLLLASASALAKDLFPRLAAKYDSGVLNDCTEIRWDGSAATVTRPLYAGKCFADGTFVESKLQVVLMRPNQLPLREPQQGASATVENVQAPAMDLKTVVKNVARGTSEKLDLTEANIIVSGGRGMKDPENFKILNELAEILGATVGASRAVVDAGWVPHSMQVGQTGKTVAPSLYIAVGISGAIQHLAGMSGSKVIVAINKDPDAPIFQKATYGIVGDLFEVVPQLTEAFKKQLQ